MKFKEIFDCMKEGTGCKEGIKTVEDGVSIYSELSGLLPNEKSPYRFIVSMQREDLILRCDSFMVKDVDELSKMYERNLEMLKSMALNFKKNELVTNDLEPVTAERYLEIKNRIESFKVGEIKLEVLSDNVIGIISVIISNLTQKGMKLMWAALPACMGDEDISTVLSNVENFKHSLDNMQKEDKYKDLINK